MKVLIINNFSRDLLVGGVENYLLELTNYLNSNTNVKSYWYGKKTRKSNWIEKFYNYNSTFEIKKIIDTFKPDLIHCFCIGAPVTPHFMKYANQKKIPILFSFRDYYYICPKNYMLTCDGKIITTHTNILDCIFNHYKRKNLIYDSLLLLKQKYHKYLIKKYINHYITPSVSLTEAIRYHFNLNGETLPNPTLLKITETKNNPEEYLLYVGRLIPEKGIITLLNAFKKIKHQFKSEKLFIVGEGNQEAYLKNFVIENKIKDVFFLGKKNRTELIEIYRNSKFIIVPSEILESYGNVILEAFSQRKTGIMSDLVGIKNEIIETKSGIIFPHKNKDSLYLSIKTLLTDLNQKKIMEINAINYVKELSFESHFIKLHQIYLNVICENKRNKNH